MTSPLIIDCFVFNDEIDLFNLRVNELDDVVDYFIVVDSVYSWQNKLKKSFIPDLKNKYPGLPYHKIFFFTLPSLPSVSGFNQVILQDEFMSELYTNCMSSSIFSNSTPAFQNDFFQRESLLSTANHFLRERISANDFIMISDIDEIPKKSSVANAVCILNEKSSITLVSFGMDEFTYACNLYTSNWVGTVMVQYSSISSDPPSINAARFCMKRNEPQFLPYNQYLLANAGFHFTSIGSLKTITNKIKSWGHVELNNFITFLFLPLNHYLGIDPFGRKRPPFRFSNKAVKYFDEPSFSYFVTTYSRNQPIPFYRFLITPFLPFMQEKSYAIYYRFQHLLDKFF